MMLLAFVLVLPCTQSVHLRQFEQNPHYNGYHCDTMINNIIVYATDGKVIPCVIPGSWNDGSISTKILPILPDRFGAFKIFVDQGLA